MPTGAIEPGNIVPQFGARCLAVGSIVYDRRLQYTAHLSGHKVLLRPVRSGHAMVCTVPSVLAQLMYLIFPGLLKSLARKLTDEINCH